MEASKIDLTATEMGYLWDTYRAQGMNLCILTYLDAICKDEEIKAINRRNMDASKNIWMK